MGRAVTATFSAVVDGTLDEVFAWHARPGALERLCPPWQPLRVVREAGSLADGRAILGLPLGVRWAAQHGGYRSPDRFVDYLDSAPLRWVLRWRHAHDFAAVDDARTRVTDRLDTTVPECALRSMFAYRYRQLAADLTVQRSARERGVGSLTVAVTGSHGLVGGSLVPFLTTAGHRVIRLVRRRPSGPDERRWHPAAPDDGLLRGVDAVVHLAGAPIGGRFTRSHLDAVRGSRIGPTRALAELAARTPDGPGVFVCASAIGYYGPDRGDEVLDEQSDRGTGFLADVVADWEAATAPALQGGLRVVNVRTGLVQSPRGGVLRLQYPLFFGGLGGKLADGRMWQSWIGIDDLVDVYYRALYDEALAAAVNAVAPRPVRNAEYTATLAHVLNRPSPLTVPETVLKGVLGGAGFHELAGASQRVRPALLSQLGHRFRHAGLDAALRHLLGREALPAAV